MVTHRHGSTPRSTATTPATPTTSPTPTSPTPTPAVTPTTSPAPTPPAPPAAPATPTISPASPIDLLALVASLQSAAASVEAVDTNPLLLHPLRIDERRATDRVIHRSPDGMINLVVQAARQNSGVIAGLAFDPDQAANIVDYASKVEVIAEALIRVAEHLRDDARQRKVQVCVATNGVLQVLRSGMRKRTAVASVVAFKSLYDKLVVTAREARTSKPRAPKKIKSKATSHSTHTTTAGTTPVTAPTAGAPVANTTPAPTPVVPASTGSASNGTNGGAHSA